MKTIYESFGDVYISFTDGTFIILTIEDRHDGFAYSSPRVGVQDYLSDTDEGLLNIGVITRAEYDEALLEEERERLERQKQYAFQISETTRQRELQQLKDLKEKYEQ